MKIQCLFLLFILSSLLNISTVTSSSLNEVKEVLAETSYGRIRGFTLRLAPTVPATDSSTEEEKQVNVFLGVPYAQPPVGELRFERPVPPKPWPSSEIRNATQYGAVCHTHLAELDEFMMRVTGGGPLSEDCLFLNVMAPGWRSEEGGGFPVVVWIHGGGYLFGSNREAPWRALAERYSTRGIVVVGIQYRVGIYGFAATGDDSFPGNLGLWDQTEALRYVQKNIAAFGGDPKRVTIWGHSAGGGSVSALSYSPHSRDLFSNVIEMSGSVFAEWSLSNRVVGETEKMAKAAGCEASLSDSKALKRCLKTKSTAELQQASKISHVQTYDTNSVRFGPRLDADFFTDDPVSILNDPKTPKKPTIIGASDAEQLMFVEPVRAFKPWNLLYVEPADYTSFNASRFAFFIEQAVANERVLGEEQAKKLRQMILDFYLKEEAENDATKTRDYRFYLTKFIEVFSDVIFVMPTLIEARLKIQAGWPMYLYLVDYYNPSHAPPELPILGAWHAVEYPAIFGAYFRPQAKIFNEKDRSFQKTFVEAIIQFIKTGNPSTPAGLQWTPAEASLAPYTLLNDHSRVIPEQLYAKKFAFWQRVREEFDFDVIRGFHKVTLHSKDEL